MAYSLDFRKRVLALKAKEKLTFKQTSERFGVSMESLFRWQKRIEPRTRRSRPAIKVDMAKLQQDTEQFPNAYNYERAARLNVSTSAIFYALKRLGITRKKTLAHKIHTQA